MMRSTFPRSRIRSRAIAVVLTCALAASLVSCAALGPRARSHAALPRLAPGITTVTGAMAMLGPPTSVSAQPDGSQLLHWRRAPATRGRPAGPLSVRFNATDRMVRVERYQGP